MWMCSDTNCQDDCVKQASCPPPEREFFIDNLLVRIHVIIVMIRWTGLAAWEFESPFPGSLTSTFQPPHHKSFEVDKIKAGA